MIGYDSIVRVLRFSERVSTDKEFPLLD
jgi:hypothetical protein